MNLGAKLRHDAVMKKHPMPPRPPQTMKLTGAAREAALRMIDDYARGLHMNDADCMEVLRVIDPAQWVYETTMRPSLESDSQEAGEQDD
jgi:hypothetical protein